MNRSILAVLAVCALSLSAAAQPVALPDSVVGVIEAPSVQTLERHLAEFTGTVTGEKVIGAPLTGVALMQLTYSTNSGLIDSEKPFRIFMVRGAGGGIETVCAFSVKGPSAFRNSLRGDLKKVGDKDGVTSYERSVQDFDRAAYMKATPEERKDIRKFIKAVTKPVFVGETETLILTGEHEAAMRNVMAMATEGKLPEGPILAGADVGLWMDVQRLRTKGAGEDVFLPGLRASIKELQAGGNPVTNKAVEEYVRGVETLARQTETISLKAVLTANDAHVRLEANVVPKSPLAAYLASVPKGALDTLKYADAASGLVCAAKVGDTHPLVEWGIAVVRGMAAPGDKSVDVWAAKARQAAEGYGGEVAFALDARMPISGTTALRMKTPATARAEVERMVEMMAPLTNVYQRGGMNMKLEDAEPVLKYGEQSIWQRKYSFDLTLPNQPEAQKAALLAMEKIYGKEMRMTSAAVGSDVVSAMGADGLERVKSILDGKSKPITASEDFKTLFAAAPAGAQVLIYARATSLMAMGMDMARGMMDAARKDGQPMPEIPPVTFPRGPGLLLTLQTTPSGLSGELALPAAEIKACYEGFKTLTDAKGKKPMGGKRAKPAPQDVKPQK